MLVKASAEDVSSFQAYTIRCLDQKGSSFTDTAHYKLMNVKEDALSNKLRMCCVFLHCSLLESLGNHMHVLFQLQQVNYSK